jgi:hypothetical protein
VRATAWAGVGGALAISAARWSAPDPGGARQVFVRHGKIDMNRAALAGLDRRDTRASRLRKPAQILLADSQFIFQRSNFARRLCEQRFDD